MNWNDIKRKLTSRKFWMSLAGFISMLVVFNGGSESTATQVTSLIMAGASVIAYVVGEGLSDASHTTVPTIEDKTSDVEATTTE